MAKQKPTPPTTPIARQLTLLQMKRQSAPFSKQSSQRRQPHSWTGIQGKTLWEWMSLLLVPLLIGLGTIWVTNRQTDAQNAMSEQLQTNAQTLAQQQRWNDLLRVYRDGIDTLLVSNGLKQSEYREVVSRVAHSRTLDILREIDQTRKECVIHYLADLELIQGFYDASGTRYPPPVSLSEANLSGANLSGANLNGAILSRANFNGANLNVTNLSGANLNGAILSGANLSGANLSDAEVTDEQLKQAKSLQGAIMPDGSRHP